MRASKFCLLIGLGFCWAAEEMFAFCVTYTAETNLSEMVFYPYIVYVPVYAFVGLLLFLRSKNDRTFLSSMAGKAVLAGGLIGPFIMGLFGSNLYAAIIGTIVFTVSVVFLNYRWFISIANTTVERSNQSLVCTAAITTSCTLIWGVTTNPALLSALFFLTSLVSSLFYDSKHRVSESPFVSKVFQKSPGWKSAIVGVGILFASFGFLQYTTYRYIPSEIPFSEALAHTVALVLVVVIIYGVKDTEHVFAAKLVATLMLVAFIVLAVFQGFFGLSSILAAAAEGVLELVIFYSLAEMAGYRKSRYGLLFGAYTLLIGLTQASGCGLSLLEHTVLPSSSYSVIGLILVVLIVVAAIWLLTDRFVVGFFWGAEPLEEPGSPEKPDLPSFEEKATRTAEQYGLTNRETEILLLFARGRSASFIAEQLFVSNNTVRSHLMHVYTKCDVHSRQELISLIDDCRG